MASDEKVKPPHVLIRQKPDSKAMGELMDGYNSELLINGQPFECVTHIEFHIRPLELAKVSIEVLTSIELDGNIRPNVTVKGEKSG